MATEVFGQNIPNSNFENWTTSTFFQEPQGFGTSNIQSYMRTQTGNVTKSTDSHNGNFAAKMETKIVGLDTIFAILTNGNLGQGGLSGGIPYTTRVDSVKFSAKFNLLAGDTATMLALFKYSGNIIGVASTNFQASSSSYINYSTAVQWFAPYPAVPDSMLFVLFSSNPGKNPVNGSYIIVDDVKLGNTLMPHGDFETWLNKSVEDADNWNSFNIISLLYPPAYAVKTTDAYSGTYALKITTTLFNDNQDTIAHVTNGRIMSDDFSGGIYVPQNPSKVSGYYKYTPVGNDSALVALRAFGFNNQANYSNLDNSILKLGAASTYTYFEIHLTYLGYPRIDTLGIAFASSNIYDNRPNVHAGSVLIIDSLNIEFAPLGIAEDYQQSNLKVYPNPASSKIFFELDNNLKNSSIKVFDVQGKIIKSENITDNYLDVSDLVNGIYFYQISNNQELSQGKFSIRH